MAKKKPVVNDEPQVEAVVDCQILDCRSGDNQVISVDIKVIYTSDGIRWYNPREGNIYLSILTVEVDDCLTVLDSELDLGILSRCLADLGNATRQNSQMLKTVDRVHRLFYGYCSEIGDLKLFDAVREKTKVTSGGGLMPNVKKAAEKLWREQLGIRDLPGQRAL